MDEVPPAFYESPQRPIGRRLWHPTWRDRLRAGIWRLLFALVPGLRHAMEGDQEP